MRTRLLVVAALALAACNAENREAIRLRDACGGGDFAACHAYGLRLEKGEYVLRDAAGAAAVFRQACDGRVANGCARLGAMHQNGALKRDSVQALDLLRQGCDGGSMEGCGLLGVRYRKGAGVVADVPRAARLFDQACQAGGRVNCAWLGELLAAGDGVPRDTRRAAALFQQSCDSTMMAGCTGLGLLMAAGDGVPRNEKAALQLLRGACDEGEGGGAACYYAAQMYINGQGVEKNVTEGAWMTRRACRQGYREACVRRTDE